MLISLFSPNFRVFGAFFAPQKVKKHLIFHHSGSFSSLALHREQFWKFDFLNRLQVLNHKKKVRSRKNTQQNFQRAITEQNLTSGRSPKLGCNKTYFLPRMALRLQTTLCVFGQKSTKQNHFLVFFEANNSRIRCQKLFFHLFHGIFCALDLAWSLGHL